MADQGLSATIKILDPPGPIGPTLVPGVNGIDPCAIPFAGCTDLVDFQPFLADQPEYVVGMITLGLIPLVDIAAAVRDTIGAAVQGEYGWAIFEVVGGALGAVVPVAGDLPGIVKDTGKWVARTAKSDDVLRFVAQGADETEALQEVFVPILKGLDPDTYASLSSTAKMNDANILRLAAGGQDLADIARLVDDPAVEIASTGGRWFDATATRGYWGREAEDFVRALTGGVAKRLDTPVNGGKFRVVDDYRKSADGAVVNEVKTGDGKFNRRLTTQLDKDADLLSKDIVSDYTWNFFPSGRADRVGPDPTLLAELKRRGIKVKVWLP